MFYENKTKRKQGGIVKKQILTFLFLIGIGVVGVHYLSKTKAQSSAAKKQELVFGSTIDMKRGVKIFSDRFRSGILLALENAEKHGGINGRVPRIIFTDDEYTPSKARENALQFLEQGIDTLVSPVGSPTLEKYLDLVEQGKLLVLFPGTGAPIFRKPHLSHLIHFRPSYFDEAKVVVRHALEELGAKKMVLFYQNDAFGKGALQGAKAMLKQKGIADWSEVSYPRNNLNFDRQAQAIKNANPDAIIFLATSISAKELIRRLGSTYLFERHLLGISDLGEDVFQVFIKNEGLSCIVVNVVPNPNTSNIKLIKEYRALAKRGRISIDVLTLEGFINATILIDILRKIKGAITKEAIIEQAEKLKNYNLKGLNLNFNRDTRELSNALWLDTGKHKWVKVTV